MTKAILAIGALVIIAVLAASSLQEASQQAVPTPSDVVTVVYTTGTVNVRACGALNCEIIHTYGRGEPIPIPRNFFNLSQLPEWVSFEYEDARTGQNRTGYINKSLLTLNPPGQGAATETNIPLPATKVPSPRIVQTPIAPTSYKTRYECQIASDVVAHMAWIRACYLQGQLSDECQQIFNPATGAYMLRIDSLLQLENDKAACTCLLPNSLANQLNQQAAWSKSLCDGLPNIMP